jgi:hypothetical protein
MKFSPNSVAQLERIRPMRATAILRRSGLRDPKHGRGDAQQARAGSKDGGFLTLLPKNSQ